MLDIVGRLDPVEAAKDGLACSRELVASVAGDLDAHNRWFKDYAAAERKKSRQHARRLRHRRAAMRRREWRHRMVRSARRVAVAVLCRARSAGRAVPETAYPAVIVLRQAIGGARMQFSASLASIDTTARSAARGCAWSMAVGMALARGQLLAATSYLGALIARGGSAGLQRLSQLLLRPLEAIVASAPGSLHGWDRRPDQVETAAMRHDNAANIPEKVHAASGPDPRSDGPQADSYNLRSRALACIEPWRARLPMVPSRAGRGILVVG